MNYKTYITYVLVIAFLMVQNLKPMLGFKVFSTLKYTVQSSYSTLILMDL